MSGVPSEITVHAVFDEIQKLLKRTKLDMEKMQCLVAVVGGCGFSQCGCLTLGYGKGS